MKSKVDCVHCDKSFSSTSNLLKHQRNVHKLTLNNSKKICQCDLCGKRFSSVPNLKRHQKHKHGIRHRIKCGKCKKFYKTTDEFDTHVESCQLEKINIASEQTIQSGSEDNSKEALLSEKENSIEGPGRRTDREVEDTGIESAEKVQHSTTPGTKVDPGNLLVCKRCLLIFKRKSYLKAHSKICRGNKYADIFKSCPVSNECYFKYRFKSTLRFHLKNVHDYDSELPENFQCKKCLLTFTKANSMKAHVKLCQGTSRTKLITCPVSSECPFRARFKDTLSLHLRNAHNFDISPPQHLAFKNFEEFKAWKKTEEEESGSQFTSQSGEKRGMKIFYCQRDGSAKPHKSLPRKTNRTLNKGRVKTGAFCPANMRYKIHVDGTVSARYYPTHSHPIEKRNTINQSRRLKRQEKKESVVTEEVGIAGMGYEVDENDVTNIDYNGNMGEIISSNVGYTVHEDEMVTVLYLPSDAEEEQKSVIRYATGLTRTNNVIDVEKAASIIAIHSTDSNYPEIDAILDGVTSTVNEIDVSAATAVIEIDSTGCLNAETVALTDNVTTTNTFTDVDSEVTVIKLHSNERDDPGRISNLDEICWKQKIKSTVDDVMSLLDSNVVEENLLLDVWQSFNMCKRQLEAAIHSKADANHKVKNHENVIVLANENY